ncbi:MAG: hypothetical protein HY895_09885 [Deltaproteobacteria bacterium]|nr:hypothetical protein [Deltaproteobacteria bacterium]
MPILTLDDVKPGMTLAQPVYTHQDRLLLETGRRISEKHLRIFKSWGVAAVAVKGGAAGDESTGMGVGLPAAEAPDDALRARFAGVLDDPVMAAIMEAAGRHLAGHGRKKKVRHGRS